VTSVDRIVHSGLESYQLNPDAKGRIDGGKRNEPEDRRIGEWTEADIEITSTKTANFLLIGFPLRLFGLTDTGSIINAGGMLFLIVLLLRDQYHREKGCQSFQDAIKRRFN